MIEAAITLPRAVSEGLGGVRVVGGTYGRRRAKVKMTMSLKEDDICTPATIHTGMRKMRISTRTSSTVMAIQLGVYCFVRQ